MINKIILPIFGLLIIGLIVYYFYPEEKLSSNVKIDHLIVYKSQRKLMAYSNGKLLKVYTISLGKYPVGDKEFEGDKKTPEGVYFINAKNPHSGYYKNLGISYPNKKDIETSKQRGKLTGGNIKIHGIKNRLGFIGKFQRWYDWTAGCMALTDSEIDELYNSVSVGTEIEIKP